jgi:hypothetical protein
LTLASLLQRRAAQNGIPLSVQALMKAPRSVGNFRAENWDS